MVNIRAKFEVSSLNLSRHHHPRQI